MKELNGFYRGIIVQNNDPLKLGRVKVFVPHLHMALVDMDPRDYDKEFYFSEFGTNYNKSNQNMIDLTKYIEKIKMKLPWAEVSLPVTGGGYSSFNSASNRASTSDSPYYVNQQEEKDNSTGAPAGALEQSYPPKDKFSASTDTPNPLGSAYTAQSYYNAPKGMFGIPQVNTKVWLFFLEGNPNNPIVFGYSPSPSSYNQIYDDTTYPSGYENNDATGEANPENLKKQTRTAMNYPGGSLTFDGTNNNEEISLAHDAGSFDKFSHSGKSSLVIGQKQSLVKGDSFTTIEGSQSSYYGDKVEHIFGSDLNISVGPLNYAAAQRWKDAAANIHAVKSLPEVQNSDNSSVFSSPLAKKSGKNPPCRACSSGEKRPTYSGKNGVGSEENLNLLNKAQKSFEDGIKSLKDNFLSFLSDSVGLDVGNIVEEQYPKTENCPICKGTGESPSTMGGEFPKEERKNEIGNLYLQNAQEFFEAENEMGGDVTAAIGGNVFISVGCATNDFDSIRINKTGSATTANVKLDPEMGLYSAPVVSSTVELNHVDKFPGGQFTIDAGNGISLNGGSGGCEMSSTGLLSLYGTVTELTGEQVNVSSKSGMSISTGESLSFNAANIAIESSGQTCIKGSIAFDGNLMCTGGAMVQGEMYVQHITGPMENQLTDFHPELYGSANSGSALKIGFLKNNQTILMDIPGLGSNIPCVVKQTVEIVTTDGGQTADDECIYVFPHQHVYRSIPMTLGGTYADARKSAAESGMGGSKPIAASPITPGLKAPNIPFMAPDSAFGKNQKGMAPKVSPLKFAAPTG
jgi:hypothetical protein